MAKVLIPALAGGAALALVATAGVATAMHNNEVELTVDGQSRAVSARDHTVGEVLKAEGIELGAHDVVLPSADTAITDGLEIAVSYGRPLELNVDGDRRTVWTTAQTVGKALGELRLDEDDSLVSASRSESLGREGLAVEISTAKDVVVARAGQKKKVRVAGSVEQALAAAEVKHDADDQIVPALDTALTDGLEIKFTEVEVKTVEKKKAVPFKKTQIKSEKLPTGERQVSKKGVAGSAVETIAQTYHNGKLVSSKVTATKVTKEAVDQVTTVGTGKAVEDEETAQDDLTPASGSSCRASYYQTGHTTANGEPFNPSGLSAAHLTMKFGTKLKVTNPNNGKTVILRINDRGPYVGDRCLDLSRGAMEAIGGISSGVLTVNYEVIS